MNRWEKIHADALSKALELSNCSMPTGMQIALELVCQYAARLEEALGCVVASPWTLQKVTPWPVTPEEQRELDYERDCRNARKDTV